MIKKRITSYRKAHKERIEEFTTMGKLFFDRPLLKFFVLILIYFVLNSIGGNFPNNIVTRLVINIIEIMIAVYFIAVIVFLIRRWYNHFLNPKNLGGLILTYAMFILGILLMFSTFLSMIEISRLGYIKYGTCNGSFNPALVTTDPFLSREFFYFTGVTFFTVGYGDICPMGLAKQFALLVAFAGHLISVVFVALIINNYIRKKEN